MPSSGRATATALDRMRRGFHLGATRKSDAFPAEKVIIEATKKLATNASSALTGERHTRSPVSGLREFTVVPYLKGREVVLMEDHFDGYARKRRSPG